MSESPLPSVPVESITSRIFLIRGQKVILDSDLADLYGVTTKVFNQAKEMFLSPFPAFTLRSSETTLVSRTNIRRGPLADKGWLYERHRTQDLRCPASPAYR
ncbi:MAG: ORF6N domain-containing protein [Leptospirales bacterium]